MSTSSNELRDVKHAIETYYQQKYGDVSINIDQFTPIHKNAAQIQVTISKDASFVTRYYGNAYYDGQQIRLEAQAI